MQHQTVRVNMAAREKVPLPIATYEVTSFGSHAREPYMFSSDVSGAKMPSGKKVVSLLRWSGLPESERTNTHTRGQAGSHDQRKRKMGRQTVHFLFCLRSVVDVVEQQFSFLGWLRVRRKPWLDFNHEIYSKNTHKCIDARQAIEYSERETSEPVPVHVSEVQQQLDIGMGSPPPFK